MSDPHLKRVAIVVVLVLAILAGSLYLFAKPGAPASVPPLAPAGASSPAQSASTSSTEPKITWFQNQIEVTLSSGQGASKDLNFTSSLALQNVILEAVPEIHGLLSVQPSSFASVSANQAQKVHVSFSIPAGTTLGTYTGTVHLRVGSTTFPQTLKVTVNVWNSLTDAAAGISVLFPPSLYNLTDANSLPNSFDLESSRSGVAIGGGVPAGSSVARSGFAIGIDSTSFSVSNKFDINQYLATEYSNSVADANVTSTTACGKLGYQIFFSGEETGNWPVVIVYQNGLVHRFLYSSTDNLSDQTGLKAFNDVIANCTLQ